MTFSLSLCRFARLLFAAGFIFATLCKAAPGDLSSALLAKVRANLDAVANDTWVSGTQLEAYLELDHPLLTVFSPTVFPLPNASSPVVSGSGYPNQTNDIVMKWYDQRPRDADELAEVVVGAAGDPASLGWGWTVAASLETDPKLQRALELALEQEIDFQLNKVPRTPDGAISHRRGTVQLWSDFVYMVPPFLAARGAATSNSSLVLEAYNQIKLYRSHLQDPKTNLWKHIVLGSGQDQDLWATGNAWAAGGMVRVMATMINSRKAQSYDEQIADLGTWANEIIQAAFARCNPDGLIPNYFNTPSFSDSSSSALLAASAFRMASLGRPQNTTNIDIAKTVRIIVNQKINPTTGWLNGSVDPLHWGQSTTQSPEGQAFIVLLQAAYLEYNSTCNAQPSNYLVGLH